MRRTALDLGERLSALQRVAVRALLASLWLAVPATISARPATRDPSRSGAPPVVSAPDLDLSLSALAPALAAYPGEIRLEPTLSDALVEQARWQLRRGERQEAARSVDRALVAEPRHSGAHSVRGLLRLVQGSPHDALADFEAARHLTPGDPAVLANLGATLLALGVLDDAREVLEQALELDPLQPEAALNLGITWDRGGDPARAARLYRRFLAVVRLDDPLRDRVEHRARLLEVQVDRGDD